MLWLLLLSHCSFSVASLLSQAKSAVEVVIFGSLQDKAKGRREKGGLECSPLGCDTLCYGPDKEEKEEALDVGPRLLLQQ